MGNVDLTGVKIAILVANGFHQNEFVAPRNFLNRAGATTIVVSPENQNVRGFSTNGHSDAFSVDTPLKSADETGFDALLLPGGRLNVAELMENHRAIAFIRSFGKGTKPIAAISHAPILLVKADLIASRKLTSEPSLQNDLKQAGADWANADVVVDENLVTCRGADDIEAFDRAFAKLCSLQKCASGSSLHTD